MPKKKTTATETPPAAPPAEDAEIIKLAAAAMGRRGGAAKTSKPKGFAALSPERVRELAMRSVESRKPDFYRKRKRRKDSRNGSK